MASTGKSKSYSICHLRSIANMLTCWVPHSLDSFYLWCWFFANPAPAGIGIRYIPNYYIIYKFIHYKGSILHARIQGR